MRQVILRQHKVAVPLRHAPTISEIRALLQAVPDSRLPVAGSNRASRHGGKVGKVFRRFWEPATPGKLSRNFAHLNLLLMLSLFVTGVGEYPAQSRQPSKNLAHLATVWLLATVFRLESAGSGPVLPRETDNGRLPRKRVVRHSARTAFRGGSVVSRRLGQPRSAGFPGQTIRGGWQCRSTPRK